MASLLLLRASRHAAATTRLASRHLCAVARVTKTSTGLVGLAVDPDYHNTLVSLYEQTLKTLEGIPEGAAYRVALEATIKRNLAIVKDAPDAETIERAIGLGQVEELAAMTRKQLAYLPEYIGASSCLARVICVLAHFRCCASCAVPPACGHTKRTWRFHVRSL
jgi:hypothetical protein